MKVSRFSLRDRARRSAGQWPAFAGIMLLYLLTLFVLNAYFIRPMPDSFAGRIVLFLFLFGICLAEFVLLVFLNTLLDILIPLDKSVDLIKAVAASILLSFMVLSSVKFALTGFHLKELELWFLIKGYRELIHEMTRTEWLIAVGVILFLSLSIFIILYFLRVLKNRRTPALRPIMAVILFLMGAGGSILLYHASPYINRTGVKYLPETMMIEKLGSLFSHSTPLQDLHLAKAGEVVGEKIHPYNVPDHFNRKHVVIILMESVPWDAIGACGGRSEVTPNMDALADEGVLFTRAYATASHSDYAQTSILSSLFPLKFKEHDSFDDIAYPRTLIWDLLKRCGWKTAMFSCQNEQWGNIIRYIDTPGLDILMNALSFPHARHRGRGVDSKVYEETVVKTWKHWFEANSNEPTLTYMNFQATHYSYEAPPTFPPLFQPFRIDFPCTFIAYPRTKVNVMKNRFFNALAYSDHWIGEVVRTLKEEGVWEDTALIIVPDHGEAFYEHDTPTHGTSLYDEQIRVPIIMHFPGVPHRIVHEAVSTLDILPTLLDYLSLPPDGNFQGRRDILSPEYNAKERPIPFCVQGMANLYGIVKGDWKYVLNMNRMEEKLYNLSEDPGEKMNRAKTDGETLLEMRDLCTRIIVDQTSYYHNALWKSGYFIKRLP